jgi:iron complex transport system permease protein
MLRHIWLTIRLPRVLLALLVGAALALSGCVMQGLFRNPLADPGLGHQQRRGAGGGLLAGAAFCRCRAVALYAPMLAAFIGSLAVMVVIFILSRAETFAVAPAAGGDRHQRPVRRAGRRPVLAEQ